MLFWKDKPVDWLLEHLLYVKACNPEKEMSHCQAQKRKLKVCGQLVRTYFFIEENFSSRGIEIHLYLDLYFDLNSSQSMNLNQVERMICGNEIYRC